MLEKIYSIADCTIFLFCVVVQSLSHVWLFVTPWTAACQVSLSFTISQSLLWERLKAGGEGDNRGWDGWMASLTQWAWVWVNSGSWWWTGKLGMLQFMGSQRVGHDWATELNWGFAQTHFHWVGSAIQPSHPLLSTSPPAFNLALYQGLFQWEGSSHQVTKVLELQLQHQYFQWIFRVDFP